jgi:hypothetical protein
MKDTGSGLAYKIVKDIYGLAADFDRPKTVNQLWSSVRMQVLETVPSYFQVSSYPRICQFVGTDPADGSTLTAIQLYPAPDRIMRINYDYYRKYTPLTSDTDTLIIPDQFMTSICYGVAKLYWLTQPDKMAIQKAEQFTKHFESAMGKMVASKYSDEAKLVQFVPYDVPGVVDKAGDEWNPADLI